MNHVFFEAYYWRPVLSNHELRMRERCDVAFHIEDNRIVITLGSPLYRRHYLVAKPGEVIGLLTRLVKSGVESAKSPAEGG